MFKLSIDYYNGEVDTIFSNDKKIITRIADELYGKEEADLWISFNNGPAVEWCERYHFGW